MNRNANILFVDDDPCIRELVKYNLELDGFNVTLAEDGRQGFETLQEGNFDLVLLDVMMPELDGLQVLALIRKNEAMDGLPVLMLTAKGMFADMERAFKVGADGYITKPFEPEKLGEEIKRKLKTIAESEY